MRLKKILKNIEYELVEGDLNKEVNELRYDSRQVKNNDLFICIQGFKTDGHLYIKQAIKNGAAVILIDRDLNNYEQKATYIKVDDSRKTMAILAKNFFNNPLKDIKLIGVTGTNGKTTSTYLIKEILNNSGYNTGLIGTIEIYDGKKSHPATRTTPESLDIYRYLSEMRKNDVKYAVMEVSSHALALNRVDSMKFITAVFTNLTQDHLDYHKTIKDYAKQKSKLFNRLTKNGKAVINNDDNYSNFFKNNTNNTTITYGIDNKADLRAKDLSLSLTGVSFLINDLKYKLKLTGKFNIYNSLAAIGVAKSLNIDSAIIKEALERVKGIPGRYETLELGQKFNVIIDYAHTPDGMQNLIDDVKKFKHNNLIIVFGCGGDRDKKKRPIMGKLAVEQGDFVILTTDNPRSEKPLSIIEDIKIGIKESTKDTPYIIVLNREKAIVQAIDMAQKGDVVIIFGKGHETYQVFADKTIDFNDKDIAKRAIKEKLKASKND
ncbi:MAG: UDP-N-acetylmuramoyl-L-alanyl-D-glutamate--2,6-diaminopimelate ligase [Halanaerobiales bacterium]|nr:UDP-N-acetylmuramoyl-L-alanyl-D-glutamate--2,6-diaminopimelate ligase [Halanaerobiales bacterium]